MTDAERYAAARKMRECLGVGPATADLLVTRGIGNLNVLAKLTPSDISEHLSHLVTAAEITAGNWTGKARHYIWDLELAFE